MAARTDRLRASGRRASGWARAACFALVALAAAGDADAGPSEWRVTEHQFTMTVYEQSGRGFQSQDGPIGEPGREDTVIFQPQMRFAIEQSERVSHDVVITADVVSAASPDAVDVVSQSSRLQEAGSISVETTARIGEDQLVAARYGVAAEENLFSVFIGGELQRELADDNATASVGVDAIFDFFADYRRDGRELPGNAFRGTVSGYLSVSQLLSPTTVAWAGYGVTVQGGDLATSINTTPIDAGGGRYKERFPGTRVRHAWTAKLAQHIPILRATMRADYRYYRDDFNLSAHTGEAQIYKYLGPRVLSRAWYRLHRQSAVAFYAESFPRGMDVDAPRTSDSDLEALWAHEVGATLSYSVSPRLQWMGGFTIDLTYFRYVRSNGLSVDVASLGYRKRW